MNKGQAKGRAAVVKGKVQQTIGKVVDDKSMEKTGQAKKIAGGFRAKFGDLKEDIKKGMPSK